jgi:hypothetical protein
MLCVCKFLLSGFYIKPGTVLVCPSCRLFTTTIQFRSFRGREKAVQSDHRRNVSMVKKKKKTTNHRTPLSFLATYCRIIMFEFRAACGSTPTVRVRIFLPNKSDTRSLRRSTVCRFNVLVCLELIFDSLCVCVCVCVCGLGVASSTDIDVLRTSTNTSHTNFVPPPVFPDE